MVTKPANMAQENVTMQSSTTEVRVVPESERMGGGDVLTRVSFVDGVRQDNAA